MTVLLQFQRRQWHPTSVLLPGKSHEWRSLAGCSPWGHIETKTMTVLLQFRSTILEWLKFKRLTTSHVDESIRSTRQLLVEI